MKLFLDTSAFFGFFNEDYRNLLFEEYPGIEKGKIKLCISSGTLEEFIFNIKQKNNELELEGKTKTERIKNFFENYRRPLSQFLSILEVLDIPSEAHMMILDEELLISSTRSNIDPYDLLHLATAVLNEVDYFLVSEEDLYEWFESREVKEALRKRIEELSILYIDKNQFEESGESKINSIMIKRT